MNQWSCTCQTGFTGNACQTVVSTCSSNTCQNGGQCTTNIFNQYICQCPSGFTGSNCQTTTSVCQLNTCLNGGSCSINSLGQSVCTCSSGFTGLFCQAPIAAPTTVAIPATTSATPTISSCIDNSPICQVFASRGFCPGNYFYKGVPLINYCAFSCKNSNCSGSVSETTPLITSPSTTTTITTTTTIRSCFDSDVFACPIVSGFCQDKYWISGLPIPTACPFSCKICVKILSIYSILIITISIFF